MIIDLTLPITEQLLVWPGDPQPELTFTRHQLEEALVTVTSFAMGAHMGTHLDAPLHFIEDGDGVETLDLEVLVGPCYVVHALDVDAITAEVLQSLAIPKGTERLLIRTHNSEQWAAGDYATFNTDYISIENDGAEWLVEQGIKLIGVDYASVAPFDNGTPTHKTLLQAGVVIVENLDMHAVERGAYQLACLPLKLVGRDGAPCRAILIR